eukprot:TRINITY_DN4881_c0_g1_i1.p1 TRINITY_DN4881_c0_g1~~TRINITY_DN4881_c0_g1_i1.p1  ORF type:complete len:470 (-),score=86.02 TRINITY_DN4881_c0_g1_i1:246-1610(-)
MQPTTRKGVNCLLLFKRTYSTSTTNTVKSLLNTHHTSKVLICGGGISGLSTALALKKKGISSEVLEHSKDFNANHLEHRGAFVSITGGRALDDLNLYEQVKKEGTPIGYYYVTNSKGQTYGKLDFNKEFMSRFRVQPLGISARSLHKILLKECQKPPSSTEGSVRFTQKTSVVSIEKSNSDLKVHFTGNRVPQSYSIVVGADGWNSKIRDLQFDPFDGYQTLTQPSGFGVVHLVVNAPWGVDDESLLEMWGTGSRVCITPIGQNKLYVWGTFNSKMPIAMSKSGLQPSTKFLEHFDDYKGYIPQIIDELTTHGPGAVEVDYPRDVSVTKLVHANTVLVGSAAHAMAPNLHQSTGLSLEDAVELADCLSKDPEISIEDALFNYETKRLKYTQTIFKDSWKMNKTGQVDTPLRNRFRDIALKWTFRSTALKAREARYLTNYHKEKKLVTSSSVNKK